MEKDVSDQIEVMKSQHESDHKLVFHHDGPFDACNPHRNVRKDRRAPMQAFPEGSANMALGGSGPLRSRLDLDKFHGREEEGFQDYGNTRKANTTYVQPQYVNPHDRIEQVHGEESYGLGTSTFLEGAPASKSALQRRESEEQTPMQDPGMGGGLQRKKSLAQRLRGMSGSQRRAGPGELRSPDARYNGVDGTGDSPPQIKAISASAGGPSRAVYTKDNEVNPFDNEYDTAFEKKGAQIRIAEQERPNVGRVRAPSSPKGAAVTRSMTAEAAVRSPGAEEDKPIGGGFLNRMKSLKGGRRARPERKDSQS